MHDQIPSTNRSLSDSRSTPVIGGNCTTPQLSGFSWLPRGRLSRNLPVLVLSCSILFGLGHWQRSCEVAESQSTSAPLPVKVVRVAQVISYERDRYYTGVLHERRRSQLSFQRPGKLISLTVDEGDAVEAGQRIAKLDDRHLLAQQVQLQSQLDEAQAVLAELVTGPRPETIAAKKAELREVIAKRHVLEGQVERRRELVHSSAVSREEYETFLSSLQAASARAELVQTQLDELLAGTRYEKIAAQRARLSQLNAQLNALEQDLQDTHLRIPYAGHIVHRWVDEGEVLDAGTAVVEVIDQAHLEAWFGLPPHAASTLAVGDTKEVMVASRPIRSAVRSLAPDVDVTTRTRNVILQLYDLDSTTTLPGQMVRMIIHEPVDLTGYWVPTTALTRGTGGLWALYVVESGSKHSIAARREIELLDTIGDQSFVRGTLQPGEAVIESGIHRLVPGQKVLAVNRSQQPKAVGH